jgi:hypothetical protein
MTTRAAKHRHWCAIYAQSEYYHRQAVRRKTRRVAKILMVSATAVTIFYFIIRVLVG